MSEDTTTIQITEAQREELREMDGSAKEALQRLIDSYNTREDAPVTLESTEYAKIADEIEGRLR